MRRYIVSLQSQDEGAALKAINIIKKRDTSSIGRASSVFGIWEDDATAEGRILVTLEASGKMTVKNLLPLYFNESETRIIDIQEIPDEYTPDVDKYPVQKFGRWAYSDADLARDGANKANAKKGKHDELERPVHDERRFLLTVADEPGRVKVEEVSSNRPFLRPTVETIADLGVRHLALLFLASPYSHESAMIEGRRYAEASFVAASLARVGWIVYSPIADKHPQAIAHNLPKDAQYWRDNSRRFIMSSDALVVLTLPGWEESEGVREEIEMAREFGLPVFYVSLDKPTSILTEPGPEPGQDSTGNGE